ncbi:MAG: Pls/PosA family non-ribosomal peptide synthetase, partial [Nocardioides sp.]
PDGLLFGGRADDQVKLGGRRIELGELDSALLALPGVVGAAAAVRRTASGNQLLVGYVVTDPAADPPYDQGTALELLRRDLPAALVPRLAEVDVIATKTSGKVDRDVLPWPLPGSDRVRPAALDGTAGWVAGLWQEVLGASVSTPDADFFDHGGGSLTAAQMVSRLRARFPDVAVGDIYERPTVGTLADYLDAMGEAGPVSDRRVPPIPVKTQAGQVVATLALRAVAGPRWLTWVALGCHALALLGLDWVPTVSWPLVLVSWLVFVTPPGRMLLAAAGCRVLLRPVAPGDHPRGGKAHLRLWVASRLADELGATGLAGAPYVRWYARLLGVRVGKGVDLHSLPPVTGWLTLGDGCSVEPEVDLSGYWIDGDVLRVGELRVGARARLGARSMLLPGAQVGDDAEVAPGSAVFGTVPAGEYWSGSPAVRVTGAARGPWSGPPASHWAWVLAYAVAASALSLIPLLAVAAVAGPLLALADPASYGELLGLVVWLPLATVLGLVVLAALVLGVVRVAALAIEAGVHPVRSGAGLAVWVTMRVLDEARTWLFPLYSSQLTPWWLRRLGARIGSDVEASTVLMVPSLTVVNDQAFLADDTLIGGYELGGGWLRVERVKVGKRAFVGNSGMAAPGRKVPKASLVAVLSAAPRRKSAKAGESWLGSPPAPLRRAAATADAGRTYHPPTRLKVLRAVVELCRLVPVMIALALTGAAAVVLAALLDGPGVVVAVLLAGPVLVVGGLVAAVVTAAAKWVLVGRIRPGAHPLWSSFVWRNELADTFVEVLAAPWFARAVAGTPLLNVWFRAMGARIGRGVWCETYWLPEADLVELGAGATVNQGSVVQTHLFHDRMLAMDKVTLRRGSTLGPNSVILPAAVLGRHATVGPVSLVMRGESVPDKTTWIGNPIGPWVART